LKAADAPILSLPEVLEALASPLALERFSTAAGLPLLITDLPPADIGLPSSLRALLAGAVDRLGQLACPTVAVVPPAIHPELEALRACFDVCVSRASALDPILRNFDERPLASLALVQLLRQGEKRSIEEGLVAESVTYSMLQAGPEFASWRASRAVRAIVEPTGEAAVLCARTGARLSIELNRPGRHNAFSKALRDGLCEALMLAACDDGIEEIVWTGRGPSFSSGGDLDEFGSFPDPASAHAIRMTRNAARLAAMVAPRLRVYVKGACMGAGAELPAFAHKVVAHPDAFFELPELALGLVPGAGGTVSVPRRIGRQATARWVLSGDRLSAESALALGLIDEIESPPIRERDQATRSGSVGSTRSR
jgi:enoyl-CoA hydratase